MKVPVKDYIGDGVYVEFDGFGIQLSTQRLDDDLGVILHWIYLEPGVMQALNDFAMRIKRELDIQPISGHVFEFDGTNKECILCNEIRTHDIHIMEENDDAGSK